MNKHRDKGRISGPFVPMLKDTMKQPAWIALSHGARSLYVALKGRYNSKLGNAVYLSTRAATLELGLHSYRDKVRRWFRELQYYGFIVMVSHGCLGVEGRGKAPHWRLTEEWYVGEPPTRDYLRWDGVVFHEQKSPKHYYRRQSRLHTLSPDSPGEDSLNTAVNTKISPANISRSLSGLGTLANAPPQKQNPGPRVQSTLDHAFSPVVDHASSPPPSASGPRVQSIQPQKPGPRVQSITSLTTPMLEKGEAVAEAGPLAARAEPADDGNIPTPRDPSTYRHRDADKRRAYMRNYMRNRRGA